MPEEYLPLKKVKELDLKAKTFLNIPENVLIENASKGVAETILCELGLPSKICVFAGRGNNSADALAALRHLLNIENNLEISIYLVLFGKKYNSEVSFQLEILRKILPESAKIIRLNSLKDVRKIQSSCDLIIDGIFGTGFKPPLALEYRELIEKINSSFARKVAVDIPSGMVCAGLENTDLAINPVRERSSFTGAGKDFLTMQGENVDDGIKSPGENFSNGVKADITITFIAPKTCFDFKQNKKYLGKVFVKNIGISRDILEKL